jgi:hypothetical protein
MDFAVHAGCSGIKDNKVMLPAHARAALPQERTQCMEDEEANRFSARAARYARVGANVGGVAARIAGARFLGGGGASGKRSAASRGR